MMNNCELLHLGTPFVARKTARGCNTGIGKLNDSPELLREAANYIEDYQ